MRLRKRTCSPGPCQKYQQAIYEIFWYQFISGTAQVDFVSGPSCTSIKMLSGSHEAWVSDYKLKIYDTEVKCNYPLF